MHDVPSEVPPAEVMRRTAAALRRVLGPPGEGLADLLEDAAAGRLEAVVALGRLARVLERAGDGASSLLIAIDTELELLRWLVHHDDERVRAAAVVAAGHQGLTSWLARDRSTVVRRVVAGSDALPGRLVELLAADDDLGVREVVASRDTLPESVASLLAGDADWQVRFALAARPGLPGVVLRLLADDPDRRVRARIGAQPDSLGRRDAPPEVWTNDGQGG
jgi:hypothetical protein